MIEFDGVGKTYRSLLSGLAGRGDVRALDQLSLVVNAGEVMGIAGPNGAGKSTLISILLGYLRPTDGVVRIAGLEPRAYVERHGVGYLSELVDVPARWTVADALERYAVLAGVRDGAVSLRVDEIVERLGLDEHRDKQVKALSKGNRQRLGLAQSLLRGERVFVLDEPTHGLDPLWTTRFREIVAALKHPARAIVIASHNLEELERLCDRVAILDRGQLQRVVEVTRVLPMTAAVVYRITVASGADALEAVFPGAVELGRGDWAVRADDLASLNRGVAELIARGTLLAGVAPAQSALEQQFQEAIGEVVL
jgi:ABC-2 type transport system ATP-binding protein